MKLIFAGTPPFAAAALESLVVAGHDVVLVLTQPDRPAGRGQRMISHAVAQTAERLTLRLEKPLSLKSATVHDQLRQAGADVMVVAAYGHLLPQEVLEIPAMGCLNIHGSLLPRWRGAAPVQRAIEAGDTETGIAIMQMDAGLDTGSVLLEKKIDIAPDDTAASLFEKLTPLGAAAIVEALAKLSTLAATTQATVGVTYAHKINKNEAPINWHQPAIQIERRMRAFDPFPGCEAHVGGERLKIWQARVVEARDAGANPGTIVHVDGKTLIVQCGQHQLEWLTVQKPGSKRVAIGEFLRGNPITAGTQLS